MAEYARDDYKELPEYIDFSKYKTIADVGGGVGVLLSYVAQKYPKIQCFLLDLPDVLDLIKNRLPENITTVPANFFEPLPIKADAIILSRVLHDWDDENATKILVNCHNALNQNGHLIIIESLQDKIPTPALSLNMQIICGSYERTSSQFQELLQKNNFTLKNIKHYKEHHFILVAEKN